MDEVRKPCLHFSEAFGVEAATVDALVNYIAAIASHAPGLPFYYYHTSMSGVALPMVKFLEAAERRLPTLAGIKFNSPDLYEFQNCQRACGEKANCDLAGISYQRDGDGSVGHCHIVMRTINTNKCGDCSAYR